MTKDKRLGGPALWAHVHMWETQKKRLASSFRLPHLWPFREESEMEALSFSVNDLSKVNVLERQ